MSWSGHGKYIFYSDQNLTSATAQVPIGEEPRAICCSISLVEGARSFENILTGHIFCLSSRSSSEKRIDGNKYVSLFFFKYRVKISKKNDQIVLCKLIHVREEGSRKSER